MIPRFTKGQPLTASDLNELADAACMNIMGGSGVAITRLGKKIVVNKRLGQKIQRGGIYGNVWKLSADSGVVQWGFDTGDSARSVCATASAVYVAGDRNNNWSDSGAQASVWRLSPNGKLVWGKDFGSGINSFEVHATEDAVFVGYFDGGAKIAKLDPVDGATIASVDVLFGSAALRHGFGINATQLWTWSTVTSAQGIRVYDHDLNSIYSATPPPTGTVDIAWGIGVSDDLVAFGAAYSMEFPSLGVTNEILTVTDTTISPNPVTQFSIAEDVSSAPPPADFEIHSNVDVEETLVAAWYFSEETDASNLIIYDTAGTVIYDPSIDATLSGGSVGRSGDVAIDETEGKFYCATASRVGAIDGVGLVDADANFVTRNLLAFDIATGALVWQWSPLNEAGTSDESLLCVFADRAGSVYTTANNARQPAMKRAD